MIFIIQLQQYWPSIIIDLSLIYLNFLQERLVVKGSLIVIVKEVLFGEIAVNSRIFRLQQFRQRSIVDIIFPFHTEKHDNWDPRFLARASQHSVLHTIILAIWQNLMIPKQEQTSSLKERRYIYTHMYKSTIKLT